MQPSRPSAYRVRRLHPRKLGDVKEPQTGNSLEFTDVLRGHGKTESESRCRNLHIPRTDCIALALQFRPNPRMLTRFRQRERRDPKIPDYALHESDASFAHRGVDCALAAVQEFRCRDCGDPKNLRSAAISTKLSRITPMRGQPAGRPPQRWRQGRARMPQPRVRRDATA